MTQQLDLAIIDGDGIGPEVTAEGLAALMAALAATNTDIDVTPTFYDLGARRYHATGEILNDDTLETLRHHDAIMLGAIGDPSVPSGILERGLLLKLRFAFEQYINLRPTQLFPGVESPLKDPGAIDFVVVREGTEGLYVGNGGSIRTATPHEIATEVSVNTAFGVERTVRFAFEQARRRERHHLTLVHKHNVLVNAGGMWQRIVNTVAGEYPEVSVDYLHVDAATIFMVTNPGRFDVIVTDNLFGDILTDLAAAVSGGIGLAASGNINPEGTAPSMFEPIHGSAPDIAGQGIADPTASILSAVLLLDQLGATAAAQALQAAVAQDFAARGSGVGHRSTKDVGQSIIANLERAALVNK